ncbi:MAG: electron transfer flavoprotein subunit beta/FixA family protein, partial [Deinococcota bacterium]|nr:electron transfer flavoprotein subunit beta/FixA family protein [Deinococcota bacterium]
IIKQVPDAEARIRASADGVDLDGVSFVIDGMDEYGVEEALRLREGGEDAEIVVLALGPKRFEESIRTALAMGADRAVHVETDAVIDPIAQAEALAKVIAEEGADLVFVGGKQADWDSSALGPAVAEALGWPHSDWTTRLELTGGALEVVHDSDEGSETLSLPLPAVVTTQQGLNDPRYPTLPNIMKAKRKEMKKLGLDELGGATAKTHILKEEVQTRNRLNKVLTGDPAEAGAELARLLRDEAKVI